MSMAEVIESIEKDMQRELESRSVPEDQQEVIDCTTLGEEPEVVDCRTLEDKTEYCSTCSHYIVRDGECCNADSDYCGGFRLLDDSCEHWEGWNSGI